MREFNLEDIFVLSEIIDKTEVDIDLNAFLDAGMKKDNKAAYLGGQLVLTLVKKMHKARNEITVFIAGLTGDDIEVVKKYNIAKITEVFTSIFNHPDFKSFFSKAGDSIAKN